ncbi:hypothetical protein GCM10020331_002830 [Ectobacillus funiculus]
MYENMILKRTGWAAKYWSPIIEAEHLHTRQYAGLYDMTAAKKRLEISGEGALEFFYNNSQQAISIFQSDMR